MKILHIVRQFYPMIGGLENFVLSLAQEQIRMGSYVSVLTLNRSFIDNSHLPKYSNYDKIDIYRIPFFGTKKYPLAFSCLSYLSKYEIIHVHGVDFFADYIAIMKVFHHKKIILHTHGGFFHTSKAYWFKKTFFNTITRITIKFYDRIIAISDNDLKLFQKLTKNIVLIENGVNVEKYNHQKKIKKGVLLFVGRIDVHKGLDNLIKVIILLNEKCINSSLRIVGPDWKGIKRSLEKMVPKQLMEKVIFLGPVDDSTLVVEYAQAHLFVSASNYEGFGLTAIEAMASGTLTILNDIDSFRSFLSDKAFGRIVNFNDPQSVVPIITEFLSLQDDKYLQLSNDARLFAQNFSWNIVGERIQRVYSECLKNNSR